LSGTLGLAWRGLNRRAQIGDDISPELLVSSTQAESRAEAEIIRDGHERFGSSIASTGTTGSERTWYSPGHASGTAFGSL
jgi:hypothetical protein